MANVGSRASQPELAPGTHVGRYEIVGELGRGGRGVVYLAHDSSLGRNVALKSPLPEFASVEDRHRFLTEARTASRVTHPAIVPVFEAFEDQGRPWLAMALADGRSLRAVLAERGRLPVEEALRHAETLADALEAAHARRVLHRDVTPNNIFITPDGRAVLMDFGLAQFFAPASDGSGTSTGGSSGVSSGEVAGTLGYMSPEQLLARPVGPTTDIFGLGAVLYEMCTGRRAFPGKSGGEILDATLHHEPQPISRVASVPPGLEPIVRKALSKRADERYATAKDLLVDVRALRRQIEGVTPRPVRVRERRWLTLALGATAAVMVLAWLAWRSSDAMPAALPRQLTAVSGWEADPAISPDGSLVAYAAEQAGNVDIWVLDTRSGEPLRLTEGPTTERAPSWFPDGSALAYAASEADESDLWTGGSAIWRIPRLGGPPVLLLPNGADPAISPDGTRIAFTRVGPGKFARVFVAPLIDPGRARMVTESGDASNQAEPAWSPDSAWLAFNARGDVWVAPAAGGNARRLTADPDYDSDPAWSSDGRHVYYSSSREGTLAVWRVPSSGGRAVRVTMGTGPESHPSISREGRQLVYSTLLQQADIVVRDIATGVEHPIGDLWDDVSPVLSPDARSLAFISKRLGGNYSLWLQPLSADGRAAGAPRRLTHHPEVAAQPSFSPDGRWIAYQRMLSGRRGIWTVPVTGGSPTRFTDHAADAFHPDWSPDGRHLAWSSDRAGARHIWVGPVLDGRPAGAPRSVTDGTPNDYAPSWSPDGSRIAFVRSGAQAPGVEGTAGPDVWTVAASGGAPRRVTRAAHAMRVCWDWGTPGHLLVSALWGDSRFSIRRVPDGPPGPAPGAAIAWLGPGASRTDLDVSHDGRLLVFGREERRGDVWILDATRGKY